MIVTVDGAGIVGGTGSASGAGRAGAGIAGAGIAEVIGAIAVGVISVSDADSAGAAIRPCHSSRIRGIECCKLRAPRETS